MGGSLPFKSGTRVSNTFIETDTRKDDEDEGPFNFFLVLDKLLTPVASSSLLLTLLLFISLNELNDMILNELTGEDAPSFSLTLEGNASVIDDHRHKYSLLYHLFLSRNDLNRNDSGINHLLISIFLICNSNPVISYFAAALKGCEFFLFVCI